MTKPTNLRDLITYLGQHPRLRLEGFAPGIPDERAFVRYENGCLYTKPPGADDSQATFVPLLCRVGGSETGLVIHDQGFDVKKFGQCFRFIFHEDSENAIA